MTIDVLRDLSAEWHEITDGIESNGGIELLERARSLVIQSWYDYELLVTACLTALQAVEATFRHVVFPDVARRVPFRSLVNRAEREGLFTSAQTEVILSGVELRNLLSHPEGRTAFTLGIAASIVRVSHLVVRDAWIARGGASNDRLM